MAGPSIDHWKWFRQPDAELKDGFIIEGEKKIPYYPGDYKTEILNEIRLVYNENDAVQFIKEWGLLGHPESTSVLKDRNTELDIIENYLFHTKRLTTNLPKEYRSYQELYIYRGEEFEELEKIEAEVLDNFSKIDDFDGIFYGEHLCDKNVHPHSDRKKAVYYGKVRMIGEKVDLIKDFAEYIRDITDILRLLNLYNEVDLYNEDPHTADYETKQWIESLPKIIIDFMPIYIKGSLHDYEVQRIQDFESHEAIKRVINSFEEGRAKDKEHRKNVSESLYRYILDTLLADEREGATGIATQGVWIKLNKETGEPEINFDSLYWFINYEILSESTSWPEKCRDPKCNKVFFPARKGQRYCPPLAGEKRSRCEQRHGKALRREKQKEGIK